MSCMKINNVFQKIGKILKIYVDLVKCMQVGENMKNLWIIFDYVKCVKDWTTLVDYMYDSTIIRY